MTHQVAKETKTLAVRRSDAVGEALRLLPVRDSAKTHAYRVLKGYSGYLLEIHRSVGSVWVRKTAPSPSDNEKLAKEALKLEQLRGRTTPLFRVPQLYGAGFVEGGRFFYEMEYVVGTTLERQLLEMGLPSIRKTAANLNKIHEHLASSSHLLQAPSITAAEYITTKLANCLASMKARRPRDQADPRILARFECDVGALRLDAQQLVTTSAFCHGDLALDNILVSKTGELWLIDPLSTECENEYVDPAKVLQSSLAGWAQIKKGSLRIDVQEEIVYLRQSSKAAEFNREYLRGLDSSIDRVQLSLFLGVTLARIVPYTNQRTQTEALLILASRFIRQYNERKPLQT